MPTVHLGNLHSRFLTCDRPPLSPLYDADAICRVVFREVYVEIRSMLEVNLLHRFLHTEGFRKVQVDTPPTGAAKHGFGAADNV